MRINENIVELKIFDFEVEHNEITDLLSLEPTCIWTKGEEYVFGDKTKEVWKIREKNYWEYRKVNISNDWIGNDVAAFIEEIIIPRKDVIRKLAEQLHIEFSVVQYMYDGCNPGLYFDKNAVKVLSECGLELNIDLYVLYQEDRQD
ncbi:DUF4279 domain-containing protein [Persicitalea sp.]|uniref:DUF4279 domain-containing protein n=1 Tax=Persicitalea sp. TaxID=3100273 RepID=UPI0035943C73